MLLSLICESMINVVCFVVLLCVYIYDRYCYFDLMLSIDVLFLVLFVQSCFCFNCGYCRTKSRSIMTTCLFPNNSSKTASDILSDLRSCPNR